jgi:hypothetical protein
MPTTTQVRRPIGARRLGYAIGAVVNTILLVLVNGSPGWEALPFLTAGTAQVLTLVNVSIAAGIVINLARIAYDPRWFVAFGDVISTGIGAAALLRIWQVFPFQFGTGTVDWALIVRVVLVVALAGSAIGIVAGLVSMVRAIAGTEGAAADDGRGGGSS